MSNAELRTVIAGEIIKKNLTEIEASEQYGMSVHWYRRARWAGNGPRYLKMSGAVLYPVTELDAFFDTRLVKSTSESACRKPSATGRA